MILYMAMADSYNELGPLTYLVGQITVVSAPLKQLSDGLFLPLEIARIKDRAIRDVLIFGEHYSLYLRGHILIINRLSIKLTETVLRLPAYEKMHEMERYKYAKCQELGEQLDDLRNFFTQMGESMDF